MSLTNLKNILIPDLARAIKNTFLLPVLLVTFSISFSPYSFAIVQVVDSETEDVVRHLVSPILRAAGEDPTTVRIYVLLDDQINAFVSGGRNIFLNTGVITSFNDPDVLKGVIAHELGHIAGGHLARKDEKMRDIQKQSIVAMSLLGVAAAVSGRPDALLGGIAGQSQLFARDYLSHSRSQEVSADQASVKFLHDSKNTLKGIIKLQNYLTQKQSHYVKEVNPYDITHPLSDTRLATLKLALKEEPKEYRSSDLERKEYSRIVAKLRGFLKRTNGAASVVQNDLDDFSKKYEEAIILYEQYDTSGAIVILNELISIEPENGYLHELKGQILFRSGAVLESLDSYKKAVMYVKNPMMKAEYALAISNSIDFYHSQAAKQAALNEVVALLESVLASDLKSPYIYRMLATAYGKLGDLGYSNLMLAEEALMQHKYKESKQFAKLAGKHSENRSGLKLKIEDIMTAVDKTGG